MRGAEAIVKNIRFVGLNAVRKDRMKKNYRETKLDDNLRTRR
jgi:tRNA A-37 threonylcarbamoyl transferase component Bud32